jgi:uncharacterized phosphosugar-binding protein
MLAEKYGEIITGKLEKLTVEQEATLDQAARMICDSMQKGGMLHVFGSGHSHLIAREVVGRAGSLSSINLITDRSEGLAEKCYGYAEQLLQQYDLSVKIKEGEVLLIISNSGINPVPIELAMAAKDYGLHTIALTSLQHSKAMTSRHKSGKHLYDLVDLVIDNGGIYGDALVDIPELSVRAGPSSTVLGAFIMNTLILKTIEMMLSEGYDPPIMVSGNTAGYEEKNAKNVSLYQGRIEY